MKTQSSFPLHKRRGTLLALLMAAALLPMSSEAADMCGASFKSAVFPVASIDSYQVSQAQPDPIYIREKMGKIEEHSVRNGSTAAHVYLDSSVDPYLFVAFPEGNSGVGLWLDPVSGTSNLEATSKAETIEGSNGLHGVQIDLKTGSRSLNLKDSVLGSMRFIRDRELGLSVPSVVHYNDIQLVNGVLVVKRKSLNGKAEYVMQVRPKSGTRIVKTSTGYRFDSATEVQFTLEALTTETPLTPLSPKDVFLPEFLARISSEKLQAFSFLLYKEKLMAGSPRYLTKFGRDSIYTHRVLMQYMKPEAIESLLNATISSMDPRSGLVSHEQHEGDFASFERWKAGQKLDGVNDSIEDYKMIDDDFAFTFLLSNYMTAHGGRVTTFLDGKDQRGLSRRGLVKKLFAHVVRSSDAFAANPIATNLIGLHPGEPTGQWRDSENGLGNGKYPFDVNAAFVPGALKALVDIYDNRFGEFYSPVMAEKLKNSFEVWNTKVIPLFEVRVSPTQARAFGERYFRRLGIDISKLPETPKDDIVFSAISLDAAGKPIRIMHSDDSLMMTFGHPSQNYLDQLVQRVELPFPYGLMTPVGMLVANPIFTARAMQEKFTPTKYHGFVSWTMQEDLMVFGIDQQLYRKDVYGYTEARLKRARAAVETVIHSKAAFGGTEVFSISYNNGQWVAAPFAGDAKSNSNQLWSHLRMVQPKAE